MNEAIDPYRAPQAASIDPVEAMALVPAGRGRRFANFLLDYFGFFVTAFLVGIVLALTGQANWLENLSTAGNYLFGFGVMCAYYLFFEGLFGRTPGKLITGTRVVDENGGAPSFPQVVGRTLCRFIPFEAFSLLFSGDKDVRGWHDTIPKTRVVRMAQRS